LYSVKIRVVGIDAYLRPISTNNLATILVIDPNNNRIAQFVDVSFDNGIISDNLSFKLNVRPTIGIWKVQLTINRTESNEPVVEFFEVKEYVLSKIVILVEAPSYILRTDRVLEGTIEAKYTFGQNMNGDSLIEVLDESFIYNSVLKPSHPIRMVKNVQLNAEEGKTKFKFNFNSELDTYKLFLNVTVMDRVTREMVNKKFEINVYESDMVIILDPHYFEPAKINTFNVN
jgi:hypothetical protein